jgi:hypothetical protein
MNIDLEVEVLWGVGRNDPSEPQGADREWSAESSGERDLRGDEGSVPGVVEIQVMSRMMRLTLRRLWSD